MIEYDPFVGDLATLSIHYFEDELEAVRKHTQVSILTTRRVVSSSPFCCCIAGGFAHEHLSAGVARRSEHAVRGHAHLRLQARRHSLLRRVHHKQQQQQQQQHGHVAAHCVH